MLIEETTIVAAKVMGASTLGSVIALRFLPGTITQRSVSFVTSIGIGCISGGAAVERFHLVPGGYEQLGVAAIAAIFGLSVITNLMQQLPDWLQAARKLFLRS
jgi:uridine phosphorylase